jgi:hypothetical protein
LIDTRTTKAMAERVDHRPEAPAEEPLDLPDVTGGAGDELPRPRPVVEAEGLAEQRRVEVVTEIVDAALRHRFVDIAEDVVQRAAHQHGADDREGVQGQRGDVALRQDRVEDLLDEERRDHRQGVGDDNAEQHHEELNPILRQVRQKATKRAHRFTLTSLIRAERIPVHAQRTY